jgi:hypothetical protein
MLATYKKPPSAIYLIIASIITSLREIVVTVVVRIKVVKLDKRSDVKMD